MNLMKCHIAEPCHSKMKAPPKCVKAFMPSVLENHFHKLTSKLMHSDWQMKCQHNLHAPSFCTFDCHIWHPFQ